jgi:predicted lipid-binding transport protein (Tim44 family)
VSDPSQDQIPAVLSLEPRPRPRRRGRLFGGVALSAAAHLGLIAAVLMAGVGGQQMFSVDPVAVNLVSW